MITEYEERQAKLRFLYTCQKDNEIPLIINFFKDKDPYIRAEALLTLGSIGDKELYSHVIPLLNDNDQHVKYCAVECLGRLGSEHATKYLLEVAKDNSEFVVCKVINVLGRLKDKDSLDFFLLMLYNNSLSIRQEAALALESLMYIGECREKLNLFFEENPTKKEDFEQLYGMLKIHERMNRTFS
ncbi:MAG: HEAT repeat domain-containing protein [Cyanobacteriota bacterium]